MLWGAYQAGQFAAVAQSKRGLQPFSTYLNRLRSNDKQSHGSGAAAFNFFSSLKARGMPIAITRVTRH